MGWFHIGWLGSTLSRWEFNNSFLSDRLSQVGLDTGYAQFAYEFADAGRETGAPFWKLNFRYDINQALEEPCCRVEGEWREPWHGDDLMFYFGYVISSGKGTAEEVELR